MVQPVYWTFPYGNVLCEARRVVWFECEEFAQNLLIVPDQHGGVDQQRTQRLSFVGGGGGQSALNSERMCREVEICRWGGRGGGSINSELREDPQTLELTVDQPPPSLPTYKFQPLSRSSLS